MNIRVNGNVITIVSEIDFEALENLAPVFIMNDNKKVYGCTISEIPSLTEAGISFTYANDEGKACLNLVTDCMQPNILATEFVHAETEALMNFKKYEDQLIVAIESATKDLEELEALVEVG